MPDNSTSSTDPSNPAPSGQTSDTTPELLDATGQPKSWVVNGAGKAFTRPPLKPLTTVYPNAMEPE
jgi:hypothetical protein